MVEKTQKREVLASNPIINNWEYLDEFLSKYIDNYYKNKDSNSVTMFLDTFFKVEERKKNIPTINIIREKLWLYFYKVHFAKKPKK